VARLAKADLAGDLAAELTPEEIVERSLRRVAAIVPGAAEASVTTPAGPFATGKLAGTLARLEECAGEGPAGDAARADASLYVVDLATDPRWPVLAREVAALEPVSGPVSLLAAALPSGGGALVVCAPGRAAFPPGVAAILPNLANRVAIAVAHAEKVRHLRQAIASRQIIGQACGILIERHRITPEQAFDRLAAASQRNHLKLSAVATGVVETGLEPEAIRP
jgi:hypothetical protein